METEKNFSGEIYGDKALELAIVLGADHMGYSYMGYTHYTYERKVPYLFAVYYFDKEGKELGYWINGLYVNKGTKGREWGAWIKQELEIKKVA